MPNWPMSSAAPEVRRLDFFEKGAGAGIRDGAQGRVQVLMGHADPVVVDRQSSRFGIQRDANRESLAVLEKRGVAVGLVT